MTQPASPGARFRAAVAEEQPLQVVGAITAYAARMAQRTGFRAIYLSGGGVAANSLGMPDLGISTMEDVLTDIRRITDVCDLPLLVDVDTGWGGAFNIARTVRSLIKAAAGALHIGDPVAAKRRAYRPGRAIVSKDGMVGRVRRPWMHGRTGISCSWRVSIRSRWKAWNRRSNARWPASRRARPPCRRARSCTLFSTYRACERKRDQLFGAGQSG